MTLYTESSELVEKIKSLIRDGEYGKAFSVLKPLIRELSSLEDALKKIFEANIDSLPTGVRLAKTNKGRFEYTDTAGIMEVLRAHKYDDLIVVAPASYTALREKLPEAVLKEIEPFVEKKLFTIFEPSPSVEVSTLNHDKLL